MRVVGGLVGGFSAKMTGESGHRRSVEGSPRFELDSS